MAGLALGANIPSDEGLPPSPLGHYLASRHAQSIHDLPAAADFLDFALEADPDNPQLLDTSFNLLMSAGRTDEALKMAKRMESAGRIGTLTRIALAIDKAKAKDYEAADAYMAGVKGDGLERFLVPMLRSWTLLKVKGIDEAAKALTPLGTVNGFEPLYELQLGLLYDAAKKPTEASKHYDQAVDEATDTTFPMIELVANFRLRQGDRKGAEALYDAFEKSHP